MTDRTDPDDLDVRLAWPGADPTAPPADLGGAPESRPDPDGGGRDGSAGRVRLRVGDGQTIGALRAEVAELRAELAEVRAELDELRRHLPGDR